MSMYDCAVCGTPRCECVIEELHKYRDDLRDLSEKYVKLDGMAGSKLSRYQLETRIKDLEKQLKEANDMIYKLNKVIRNKQ